MIVTQIIKYKVQEIYSHAADKRKSGQGPGSPIVLYYMSPVEGPEPTTMT